MEALAGEGNSEKRISHDSNAREGKIGTVTESDIAKPGPKDATEMRQKNIAPDIDAEGRAVEGAGCLGLKNLDEGASGSCMRQRGLCSSSAAGSFYHLGRNCWCN